MDINKKCVQQDSCPLSIVNSMLSLYEDARKKYQFGYYYSMLILKKEGLL